ncbi:MAG: type II secretion system protein N [Candidatus Thiodiazotropha sp.]
MKQGWKLTLLGVGTYLLFLVINLPAQHALGWLSSDTERLPFTYGRIKGTLWNGKMEAMSLRKVPLDKLSWDFAPTQLLLGRLGFDVQITHLGQTLQGTLSQGFSGDIRFTGVTGQLPAELITPLIGLAGIDISGQVSLDDANFNLEDQRLVQAEGRVLWRGSAITRPFPLKIGDLQAQVSTNPEGQVLMQIKDMGGPTGVDGEVSLATDGNFQVNGHIKPGADSDPSLGKALAAFSKRQPDGSYQVIYRDRL